MPRPPEGRGAAQQEQAFYRDGGSLLWPVLPQHLRWNYLGRLRRRLPALHRHPLSPVLRGLGNGLASGHGQPQEKDLNICHRLSLCSVCSCRNRLGPWHQEQHRGWFLHLQHCGRPLPGPLWWNTDLHCRHPHDVTHDPYVLEQQTQVHAQMCCICGHTSGMCCHGCHWNMGLVLLTQRRWLGGEGTQN